MYILGKVAVATAAAAAVLLTAPSASAAEGNSEISSLDVFSYEDVFDLEELYQSSLDVASSESLGGVTEGLTNGSSLGGILDLDELPFF